MALPRLAPSTRRRAANAAGIALHPPRLRQCPNGASGGFFRIKAQTGAYQTGSRGMTAGKGVTGNAMNA